MPREPFLALATAEVGIDPLRIAVKRTVDNAFGDVLVPEKLVLACACIRNNRWGHGIDDLAAVVGACRICFIPE